MRLRILTSLSALLLLAAPVFSSAAAAAEPSAPPSHLSTLWSSAQSVIAARAYAASLEAPQALKDFLATYPFLLSLSDTELSALNSKLEELKTPPPAPPSAPTPRPTAPQPAPAPQPPSADSILLGHLADVGINDASISWDWAANCDSPDYGAGVVQGCARSDRPGVIFMKSLSAADASSTVARGVIIHEYAHLLQYRLDYPSFEAQAIGIFGPSGVEDSADCMAVVLGSGPAPGGYTSDCSGARGTFAAESVAAARG